jgi:hypothetical protein
LSGERGKEDALTVEVDSACFDIFWILDKKFILRRGNRENDFFEGHWVGQTHSAQRYDVFGLGWHWFLNLYYTCS